MGSGKESYMRINVYGGTSRSGANLCLSCQEGKIRKDQDGKMTIKCQSFNRFVKNITIECSMYLHKNQMDMYEMKKIAHVITPGREHLAFRSFSTLSEQEKESFEGMD